MTRLEFLQTCNKQDLSRYLCAIVDNCASFRCEYCPATDFCKTGHTGWLDWLDEEYRGIKRDFKGYSWDDEDENDEEEYED